MKIVVTGATGFVGKAVVRKLIAQGDQVCPIVRHSVGWKGEFSVSDIGGNVDWGPALVQCGAVVHLAARVHVMNDTAKDALAEFRRINVGGTLNLARQAAMAGVRRFVYVSSIKVNGESTKPARPFTPGDMPAPSDYYGISKMEAEEGLSDISRETEMEVVIVRPPLVYGPGVKANFRAMMRCLKLGIPLPLGAINNQRSLVSVDNLADMLANCVRHPAASNKVFLVSDGEDLSTAQLLTRLGIALGRPARLISVPPKLLTVGATLLGSSRFTKRLCGSLQVDISETRRLLNWIPPISVDEGLRRTVEDFLRNDA